MKRENNKITFREATPQDCRLLWQWRNEPTTREASFNPHFIPYAEHEKWFAEKLKDDNAKILIILGPRGEKLGQVRYEINPSQKTAEANISLDKGYRGKGIGSQALRLTSDYVIEKSALDKVVAYIKEENISSAKAFRKAGFQNSGAVKVKGQTTIKMVLRR